VQRKALEIIAKCSVPVSIDYVAFHCQISWGTARALLMNLAADGQLKAQRITKGWIFFIDGPMKSERGPKEAVVPGHLIETEAITKRGDRGGVPNPGQEATL